MKAIMLTAAGGVENLVLSEISKPTIQNSKQLLIKLHVAGLNPVDYKLRGKGGFKPEKLPIILGCDGAGIVESIGDEVSRFKVGDEVYFWHGGLGLDDQGNYAEYTVIHEEYAAEKPQQFSMQEAAALPLAWVTAWESLVDRVYLKSGETVLIHAAAGGVGHLAVQLAKNLGATVIATVSGEEKTSYVKSLGADHCIDYRKEDFVEATLKLTDGKGVDVVFDTVGGETFCKSFSATKIYGRVVTLLEHSCNADTIKVAKQRNLSLAFELMLTPVIFNMHDARINQRKMLEQANEWIKENRLKIRIDQTFSFEEVAQAHQALETGRTFGKMVLKIV
jgi:NADPH:quinone reductase